MSPPRRSSAKRPWRLFRYLLLALLVLVAATSLALALGLGYVDRLRSPLVAALSAALGGEVTSERLVLGLAGLTPRLTLEQVVLLGRVDPDGPPPVDPAAPTPVDPAEGTRVPRLHLDLDLPASLIAG